MAAMELRRLGLVRQPWIVVPNHIIEQVGREAKQWYPAANVLLGSSATTAEGRRRFIAQSAASEWDMVIVPAVGVHRDRRLQRRAHRLHRRAARRSARAAGDSATTERTKKRIKLAIKSATVERLERLAHNSQRHRVCASKNAAATTCSSTLPTAIKAVHAVRLT